mgnify:CR=1 FL=1
MNSPLFRVPPGGSPLRQDLIRREGGSSVRHPGNQLLVALSVGLGDCGGGEYRIVTALESLELRGCDTAGRGHARDDER